MFRKMRRAKQQISREECDEVLKGAMRGVMAFLGDDDYPYAVPLDYLYVPEDGPQGRLYFHGARTGHKVDAMRAHAKASFCVLDEGVRNPKRRFGLDFRSVICFGRLHPIGDQDEAREVSRRLGMRYLGTVYTTEADVDEEVAHSGGRVFCYYLEIEHLTGKVVNES